MLAAGAATAGGPVKPAPNLPPPVQEPGMPGYTGPTAQQANSIATAYQSGVPYQQAVSQAMGTPPPAPKPAPQSNPYLSDPGYQAALAMQQSGLSQSNAALNNLIQQRIISYGDPALASMAGFGLDPQAAAFARQNYLAGNAELARIDKAHNDARTAIVNQLAGHGLLFSGDTGYQEGQADQVYGNNVYDAQQKALADILGYRQNALQSQQQAQQSVIQALEQAYTNYVNNPGVYSPPQQEQTQAQQPAANPNNQAFATSAQIAAALKRYNTAEKKNLGF